MAQAIVDPDELRRFATDLKKFNSDLQNRATALVGHLHELGTTWRDQENTKFCEEFEEHMRAIARFIDSSNRHIPYLLRKAERIEEYLQQH